MRNHLARALIGFALAATAWGQSVLTVEARDALTGAPLADATVRIESGVTTTGIDDSMIYEAVGCRSCWGRITIRSPVHQTTGIGPVIDVDVDDKPALR